MGGALILLIAEPLGFGKATALNAIAAWAGVNPCHQVEVNVGPTYQAHASVATKESATAGVNY